MRRDRQTTRWAGGGDRDGQAGPGDTAGTRASGQVGDRETGSGRPAAGGGPGGGHWWDGISRRQWLAYGGVTAGVFLVVIAAITIFELSAGKPVNAVVWGKHSTGTSVGNLVGGQSSRTQGAAPGADGQSVSPAEQLRVAEPGRVGGAVLAGPDHLGAGDPDPDADHDRHVEPGGRESFGPARRLVAVAVARPAAPPR